MSSTLEKLSPWLFTFGIFVLWELVCRIFKVDTFVLPAPSQIFQAVGQYWLPLAKNAFVTVNSGSLPPDVHGSTICGRRARGLRSHEDSEAG